MLPMQGALVQYPGVGETEISHERESVSHLGMSDSVTPCYGILQARTLEWVALPFSRVSSLPRG